MEKKLIIGIGQRMRQDDAAGVAAVVFWQARYPVHFRDPIQVEFLELPGLDLLNYLEADQRVLIVDALFSGAAPGSLRWLSEKELFGFDSGSTSAHGFGVAEALTLGRQVQPESMPSQVDFLGIEIKEAGMGDGLSPEVVGILEEAANMIEEWVGRERG